MIINGFKFPLCYECYILSFGWSPSVWILCSDVSEHCSVFIGVVLTTSTNMKQTEFFEKSAQTIQTPGNHPQDTIQMYLLFLHLADWRLMGSSNDLIVKMPARSFNDCWPCTDDFLWAITNKCICCYVYLLYYNQRSLLHASATCCGHLQGGVLWRNTA